MSPDEYAATSTERLLELFSDAAKRGVHPSEMLRAIDNLKAGKPQEKPKSIAERGPAAIEMRTVAKVLQSRLSTADARRLFEDDDPCVRVCAAVYFSHFDPEMASAGASGAYERLPTREVIALKRRALLEPPPRPTLSEMTDDAVVARFEDAAMREYATRFLESVLESQDMTVPNRISDEIWCIMQELKRRDALSRLLPLLESANITVRRRAAMACLRIAEQKSIAVLQEVAAYGGYDDNVPANTKTHCS
jgi:HEAT repeat protein